MLTCQLAARSAIIIFLLFRPPKSARRAKVPPKEKLSHMDPIGIVLALGSLIFFARALEVAGISRAWNSADVIGLLIACVVPAIAFVVSQYLLGDHALMVSAASQEASSLWA